jgi:protoheme IX farnesyltransferase
LALVIKNDYAEVGIPMLPVVAGEAATAKQIWIYTLLLVPFSFSLVAPIGAAGMLYATAAAALGFVFLQKSWQLLQSPEDRPLARSLFKYSILYMMLLCTAVVVDSLPMLHAVLN